MKLDAHAHTRYSGPDVIVGCEVTATFPRDGVRVHRNVLPAEGVSA